MSLGRSGKIVLNGHPHPLDGRTFVVTDEEGHTVLTYSFKDAIND